MRFHGTVMLVTSPSGDDNQLRDPVRSLDTTNSASRTPAWDLEVSERRGPETRAHGLAPATVKERRDRGFRVAARVRAHGRVEPTAEKREPARRGLRVLASLQDEACDEQDDCHDDAGHEEEAQEIAAEHEAGDEQGHADGCDQE